MAQRLRRKRILEVWPAFVRLVGGHPMVRRELGRPGKEAKRFWTPHHDPFEDNSSPTGGNPHALDQRSDHGDEVLRLSQKGGGVEMHGRK